MRIAIITVAGLSNRFNEGVPESKKELKAIFYIEDYRNTLLFRLLQKCLYADLILVVGGYKFDDLKNYCNSLESSIRGKIKLIYNEHFHNLGSGYSLHLGLQESFSYSPDEILFAEGDLDVDKRSFEKIVSSDKSVLTYNYEPIYANKAVVLYEDGASRYKYSFNTNHGLLSINTPFASIFNSGQIWKFTDIDALKTADCLFYRDSKWETNLKIIQNYLDSGVKVELIGIERWTNCNTKSDYKKILSYWEEER